MVRVFNRDQTELRCRTVSVRRSEVTEKEVSLTASSRATKNGALKVLIDARSKWVRNRGTIGDKSQSCEMSRSTDFQRRDVSPQISGSISAILTLSSRRCRPKIRKWRGPYRVLRKTFLSWDRELHTSNPSSVNMGPLLSTRPGRRAMRDQMAGKVRAARLQDRHTADTV